MNISKNLLIYIFLFGLLGENNLNGQIKLSGIELVTGFKYTPLEYIGGPIIGLSYQLTDQYEINLRKDFILGMGENNSDHSYSITDFCTYNYLEVARSFSDHQFSLSLGGVWIYNGSGERAFLSTSTGYYAGSVGFKINFENLRSEVRADIPIGQNQKIEDQGYLFPISLALIVPIRFSSKE